MPKKTKSPAKPNRGGFMMRLPLAIRDQINLLRQRARRTITEEVTVGLEQYLASEGFWPPKKNLGNSE